ncbi:MAG: SDR family oxidoreductase [Bacteroidales bacterium]|nr:SDR family oxidoreductase [Bacteroidales bacterium]
MKTNKLKDKIVIITGASSGIGKACAYEFTGKGAKVVLASRNADKLRTIEKDINVSGGNTISIVTDVSDESDCKNLIQQTVNYFGTIDILINNAGISMRASFEELDLSVIKKLMDTNFYGTVYCTKYALPYLLKQKGSVVGVSSISGLTPLPGRTGYCASKYAVDGFLNTLRIENIKKRLHVLTVHPGFTSSNIRNLALNKDGNPQKETPRNENRMMSSEKVAQIIAKAVIYRKRDLILTAQGKMAVWMFKIFPGLTDKLFFYEMAKESDSPFN